MTQLAVYEHAREALAAAVRFDEVTQLHTEAQKAEAYARIAKDRRLQADAAEIVARAERKLGIMLRKAKGDGLLSQGGRPSETSNLTEPETGSDAEPVFDRTSFGSGPGQPLTFTLAEIGVDKKLSMRAQQAAELADDAFEDAIEQKRGKILSTSAPIVSAPRARTSKAERPAPVQPLEPRKWHQFALSVLTLTMASDRVSSEAIHKIGEFAGVLELDGETVDFTPAAIEALGTLADVALRALDGDAVEPVTANETGGGFPVAAAPGNAEETGGLGGVDKTAHTNVGARDVTAGETATDFGERARLREAYEGEVALLLPSKGRLTKQTAEAAMRAGYAAEVPLAIMCEDLGHPHGTLATWANRLGLTSKARMHAAQHRFGDKA